MKQHVYDLAQHKYEISLGSKVRIYLALLVAELNIFLNFYKSTSK